MNPEIDLNQLVNEFLGLEKFMEESKQFESIVTAPSISDDRLLLEQDWQRFVAYKYSKARIREGLQDAMRDGYILLLERLSAMARQIGADAGGLDRE